jgi:glycosyltransferase involved in cell wall biosynthesis
MRITMLAPRASVRGPLPKHTPLLVEALRRLGCEVELFPWGRRVEGERLRSKFLGRARDAASVRRSVLRRRPDVVVVKTAHDWRTLLRDYVLLRILPRETVVVLQFHGSQSARLVSPGSRAFKRATAAVLSRADGILVLSREERADWKEFSRDVRAYAVRNPRPLLPESPAVARNQNHLPKTILCVARLMRSKGVFELVRALPLVQKTVPSRLVLAGDGPEQASVRALAAELGVGDSVDLPGYVEGTALARLYGAADVFALPTTHDEGFPTVILEAMAAGLPIVTTASRGPADHLVPERHALFVPPHDPTALATSLTRVLMDTDLERRLGDANREKVREFDADPVAREYLAALEEIARAATATA